jgi:hypothetical protein
VTEKEQTDHLANDVDNLVDRYRSEYEMSYAAVVGVLQMKIHLLCDEASERGDEVA